ncbi:hypothetical protein HHI36_016185 [Cryptolaemus montrouzieri]
MTHQRGQRQPNHQMGQQQPNAQQQLAKQQQMLVQKKQQLAQQQRQQQQKQQMAQQKVMQVQKQQEQTIQQQKDLELQKQKELEQKKLLEQQKQKEIELQKQRELEQKQKALEQQKQRELELQKKKELELQKQRELELQKKKELELQKQKELELQKQKEELQRQKELEQQKLEEQKRQELQKAQQLLQKQSIGAGNIAEDKQPPPAPSIQGESMETESEEKTPRRKFKPRKKLSKYEIQRRRNLKLSKILKPKSAMVILNEVLKNVTYNVEDYHSDGVYMYRSTVEIDGVQHEGFGLKKGTAKNNCAEKVLKYLVKHKKLVQQNPKDEAMDTSEEPNEGDMPLAWQQFASFALYKLFASWGEDVSAIKEEPRPTKKPSKKLPPNANLMNPLMLLNQMIPHAHFEELPNVFNGHYPTFKYKCTVDGQEFLGTGSSKKVAKRRTAFEVCKTVLGIEYPPEIYTPPVSTPA